MNDIATPSHPSHRSHRQPTAPMPAWRRRRQPTWACRATHAGTRLPSFLDDNGDRTLVPEGIDIPLVRAGLDDDGTEVWKIPASAWTTGDTITIGPLPDGVRIEYEVHRPHRQPSYFHPDGTYIP